MTGDGTDPDDSRAALHRAERAAAEAHRKTTTLIRMLTILGEPGTADEVLDQALYALSELFDLDGVVALEPGRLDHLILVAECGLGEDIAEQVGEWPCEGALALALDGRQPMTSSAATAGLPAPVAELGFGSVTWIPAGSSADATLLGLLRYADGPRNSSDQEILGTIAHRLGVALDQARHATRIEQLGRLGHNVSAHLDSENLLRETVQSLPGIFGGDATIGLLTDKGTVRFPSDYGLSMLHGQELAIDQLAARRCIEENEPYSSGNPQADAAYRWPATWRDCSVLAVPIPGKDAVLGLLYLFRRNTRAFSTAVRDALMLFSAQLGAALDNARLYSELRSSRAELQLITDSISDLISVLTLDGRCVYLSPSHERQLGLRMEESLNGGLAVRIHPQDRDRVRQEIATGLATAGITGPVEYRCRDASGGYVWIETIGSVLPEAGDGRIVLSSRVVSDRKELELQLRHGATHDELTGLPNRRLLLDLLRTALGQRGQLALLFLDLDRFKVVNDTLGHAAGDQLLTQVTQRLRTCLRADDVLARLGGDEFVLLFQGLAGDQDVLEQADRLAGRILATLAQPFDIEGREFVVTASIGVVLPEPGRTDVSEHELLRSADTAMYQAKSRGRARHERYDVELDRLAQERLELENDLRGALDRGELELHYQPVMAPGNRLDGVEALLRWRHPDRGLVAPLDFIPLAEELGLIRPIGSWVLFEACRQASAWAELRAERGLTPVGMAVNLSPRQIDDALHAEVLDVLADTGFDPRHLLLEVTESAYMDPTSGAPEVLAQLRASGVRIAIDDFGAGYSSFGQLRQFPADVIKIDRSFVDSVDESPTDLVIVEGMIRLARALRSDVIAEGVERAEQYELLRGVGCSLAQGYLFSKPLPAEGLLPLLVGAVPIPRVAVRAARA